MPVPMSPINVGDYLDFDNESDPIVMAGYTDCLYETLRFLLEEEKLPEDHPVIEGLVMYLTRATAHQELIKISEEIALELNDKYSVDDSDDQPHTSDDYLRESDLISGQDLLGDPVIKSHLVRMVFQGCDLVSPSYMDYLPLQEATAAL